MSHDFFELLLLLRNCELDFEEKTAELLWLPLYCCIFCGWSVIDLPSSSSRSIKYTVGVLTVGP